MMYTKKWSRREFLKITGLAALSAGLGLWSACSRSARRPNILLIMADDMGFSDIGCYGSEIHTPNLDWLAERGLRFTQFYNAARCCPTRASLLTGLYPHQAGMGGMVSTTNPPGPYQGYLNDQCVTIAEVLGEGGYTTLMSGKWHVGEEQPHWPTDRGFDRYFGLISGAANYFDISRTKRPDITRQMALDGEPYTPPEEGFYMTDAFTDHAVQFLNEHDREESSPFFLYLAYTAPHWPLHAWPEDIARYEGDYRTGWSALRKQRYDRLIEMGIIEDHWALSPPDAEVEPWSSVEDVELMDLKMAVYAAQIDRMDQGIGKVLDTLRAQDELDNTLVMFLSDNGGCHEENVSDRANMNIPPGGEDSYTSYGRPWANASNTPFRLYKHWVHEGGIATPLIAYWPGVIRQQGEFTDQVGHVIDLMATCCDVAGVKYPDKYRGREITPLEGKSLVPIFHGRTRDGHDAIFWEHMGNKAVRRGTWKLVSTSAGKWELYDMERDRSELNDLADQYPEKVDELVDQYQRWAKRCGVNQKPA